MFFLFLFLLFHLEVKPKRIGYHQTQLSESLAAKKHSKSHSEICKRKIRASAVKHTHIQTIRLLTTKRPKPNKSSKIHTTKAHLTNQQTKIIQKK